MEAELTAREQMKALVAGKSLPRVRGKGYIKLNSAGHLVNHEGVFLLSWHPNTFRPKPVKKRPRKKTEAVA